ncbi:MAG: TetR/AcrR family transcriptional regulator [Planctomycetes bacterium]|nr:TetR/AcrR family transcriptional regulator [Planctomycetota bacterium]
MPPTQRTPPTAEAGSTRERILEVAARLFHEQGYHATGVATIAREAGVLPGSLYHFFPSKEHLLLGTLEWRLAALRPVVTDPVEATTQDGVERVFALLQRYREGLELTGCRQGCPVGNLALELSDDHPAVRELLDANFANWIDAVAEWLAPRCARARPPCDPRSLASFVLTVMEGGIMLARARKSTEPFDDAVTALRRHFDLVLPPEPAANPPQP